MPSPKAMLKMNNKNFKGEVEKVDRIKVLLSLSKTVTETEALEAADKARREKVIKRRVSALCNNLSTVESDREFKTRLSLIQNYNKLNRLRNEFATSGNKSRLHTVNKHMKTLEQNGQFKVKRRIPGTGKAVEQTLQYANTTRNAQLNRVGKTYTKRLYEGAEFETVDRRIRKRRVKPDSTTKGAKGTWLRAIDQARQEYEAETGNTLPKFLAPRKEVSDPEDSVQVLGNEIYKRAIEIATKEKAKADEAEANFDQATAAPSGAMEITFEE